MKRKKHGRIVEAGTWLQHQTAGDPAFAASVEAELAAMRWEQQLLRLREASGLSQRQLADRLGVSQPFVAKLESGRLRNLELRTLVRTVAALGGEVRVSIRARPRTSRGRGKPRRATGRRARRASGG